ncbi:MAG: type II toxin-antitoxin system Phd/YefM family antitoxin [Candidatus Electryonea clarkiae]|nr:type II toxin-antitoxin system Phd/YefM family antitoxin [Candidatus Electryonea clarkiae]MDP8287387.1 type II toxin-antitoxin system Phd/YefM family antitoxin [Candidatus Electryonea clarkiae]
MIRISASNFLKKFAETLNRVVFGNERVVLHRHNQDVAVLLSYEDFKSLEEIEEMIDFRDAKKALAEAKEKGTISHEQLLVELGLGN